MSMSRYEGHKCPHCKNEISGGPVKQVATGIKPFGDCPQCLKKFNAVTWDRDHIHLVKEGY